MTKDVSAAAALKLERQRDMAQATREYEKEQNARRVNMLRLRELRVAKEEAETKANAPMQPKRKKRAASTDAP